MSVAVVDGTNVKLEPGNSSKAFDQQAIVKQPI